jgi:hypothetical protein
MEVAMDRFVHDENIALYRKLIALGEGDLARDEARHQMLLRLLAEEEAKDKEPQQSSLPDAWCDARTIVHSANPGTVQTA